MVFVAATVGGIASVRAAPDEVPPARRAIRFDDRPFVLHGVAGFGSHVGVYGLQAQYTIVEALAVGAGAGIGASEALQVAGFVNFRPVTWSGKRTVNALSVMGAYSTGKYLGYDLETILIPGMSSMDHSGNEELHYASDRAHWLQVDAGFEHRLRGGFSVRTAMGAAFMLNPSSVVCRTLSGEVLPCVGDVEGPPPNAPIFTFSVALGYAF